ncbi:hypothetical protein KSP39_PZI010731 [Platanthera zijinensis]|uniref:J domain-containing protein n=2 Tax=Platanthera zijinensis TaxID=2320716 RepID=A0AAP0G6H2_9ASPA
MEEIKEAYQRLSKEYHPDTTSLPLKTASEKFVQLREAYNVLIGEESRKFYDWTLVQEAESRRASLKLKDPYEQDVKNTEFITDTVKNLLEVHLLPGFKLTFQWEYGSFKGVVGGMKIEERKQVRGEEMN